MKSKEDGVEDIVKYYKDNTIYNLINSKDIGFIFNAGIAFAEQWISVEDELPEDNKEVLVKVSNSQHQFKIAYYNKEQKIWYEYFKGEWYKIENPIKIIAWKPINRK